MGERHLWSSFTRCFYVPGDSGGGSDAEGGSAAGDGVDDYIGAGNLPPSETESDSDEEPAAAGQYLDRGFLPPSDSEEEDEEEDGKAEGAEKGNRPSSQGAGMEVAAQGLSGLGIS